MSTAKVITVFGATGQQGGSVARALQASGKFKVRAVTRNRDGEKAAVLKAQGIDVVQASLDDPESLPGAITGSYGVFVVTNYWQYMDKAIEIKQGKDVADACKKAGVQHLVYSGLELVKDITGWNCPHFDSKGEVEKYLDEIQIPNTSVRLAFYFQAFLAKELYQKQEDGSYVFTTCMQGQMDSVNVDDLGNVVMAILLDPEEYVGKKIGLSGDRLTMEEYTSIISTISGKKIKVTKVPHEVFAKFPFPAADDIAATFHFYDNGNPVRDRELTKKLNPETSLFKQWAEKNNDLFNF